MGAVSVLPAVRRDIRRVSHALELGRETALHKSECGRLGFGEPGRMATAEMGGLRGSRALSRASGQLRKRPGALRISAWQTGLPAGLPMPCCCGGRWMNDSSSAVGKVHSAPSRHSFSCGLPRRHRARFAHGAIGSRNPPAQCRGEGSALRAALSVGSKSTGSGRSPARARTRRAAAFAPLELPSAMRTRSCSSATS